MPSSDATRAVHDLVLAVQEALRCGARATDTDGTGALTEMHNRGQHASKCLKQIEQALHSSLSSVADSGAMPLACAGSWLQL